MTVSIWKATDDAYGSGEFRYAIVRDETWFLVVVTADRRVQAKDSKVVLTRECEVVLWDATQHSGIQSPVEDEAHQWLKVDALDPIVESCFSLEEVEGTIEAMLTD